MMSEQVDKILEHENGVIGDKEHDESVIEVKGRNSRKPKKANHGARPCSSYMRKLKRRGWANGLHGTD